MAPFFQCINTCWYPLAMFGIEKYPRISLLVHYVLYSRTGKESPMIFSFNLRKSATTLHFFSSLGPNFFGSINSCEFHGLLLVWTIPTQLVVQSLPLHLGQSVTCLADRWLILQQGNLVGDVPCIG